MSVLRRAGHPSVTTSPPVHGHGRARGHLGDGGALHRARGSGAGWPRCATTRRPRSAWGADPAPQALATTVSGFFLGVAGAPFPYYVTFVEPNSAFALDYAVNALAMPMIGGTTSWVGPVIGAVLLGAAQQLATVTISSEMNLFIVGVVWSPSSSWRPRASSAWSPPARSLTPMAGALLEVEPHQALRRLHRGEPADAHVKPGERFGLIGPNGSGKRPRSSTACPARSPWTAAGFSSMARRSRAAPSSADAARHRADLPDSEAVTSMTGLENSTSR